MTHPAVKVVERSQNAKIGAASATYVTQTSCPDSCTLKQGGCYANHSFIGIITGALNREGANSNVLELAQAEAEGIRELSGALPLRVHVVGDCTTNEAAQVVSSAMLEHEAKDYQPAWTYTHAWRDVDRASWGATSVLASCETVQDVRDAAARWYSGALVVDHFENDTSYKLEDVTVIPCPEQTGHVRTCAECRLCMGVDTLERRRERKQVIGFALHGNVRAGKAALARRGGVNG